MKNIFRSLAMVLLTILALSGLAGGWSLMSDPTGTAINIPISLLDDTPFVDFLIPGIILFTFLGFSALVILWWVIKRFRYYSWLVIIQGGILFVWLSVQLFLNPGFYYPLLHIPFFLLAGLLVFAGVALTGVEKEEQLLHEAI